MNHSALKERILKETKRFFLYTIVLSLFFSALISYDRILLGQESTHYFPYGYSIIEAIILTKVIIIGDLLGLGKKFSDKPLIIPVIYKTLVFCIVMFILMAIERIIIGYFESKSIVQIYNYFISKGLNIVLAKLVIMAFVFLAFFSILETADALGGNKLFTLFFGEWKKEH